MKEIKFCPKCKTKKTINGFSSNINNKDGRQTYCKVCSNIESKKYYWLHLEQCRLSTQRCNINLKIDIFKHYSGDTPHCASCGEKDILVLCLDHINGGGEKHRHSLNVIGGIAFYRKLKKQGYPVGYQILCANCNLRKEMIKTRGI